MENLKRQYYKGAKRRTNLAFKRAAYQRSKALAEQNMPEFRQYRALMRSLHSQDLMDPNFRRIWYVRYADDFMIGISGPRDMALEIMDKVRKFL